MASLQSTRLNTIRVETANDAHTDQQPEHMADERIKGTDMFDDIGSDHFEVITNPQESK